MCQLCTPFWKSLATILCAMIRAFCPSKAHSPAYGPIRSLFLVIRTEMVNIFIEALSDKLPKP